METLIVDRGSHRPPLLFNSGAASRRERSVERVALFFFFRFRHIPRTGSHTFFSFFTTQSPAWGVGKPRDFELPPSPLCRRVADSAPDSILLNRFFFSLIGSNFFFHYSTLS